jgi:predicted dehydrogenase
MDIAVIGLGHMGMLHLKNSIYMKDVNVVAVADSSKRALARANRFGVQHRFQDYRILLDQFRDIDAAIIALPNYLHFPASKLALEAGLNVFTEKPIAKNLEECQELQRLVHKSGRKFSIGHNLRYINAILHMKQAMDQGVIGDLQVATLEDVINGPIEHALTPKPISDWWFDRSTSGGGVLVDLGYHLIDLFQFFTGNCQVEASYLSNYLNLPIEDGAIIILRSVQSGAKGIINVGWYQKTVFPRYNFRVILHGTAGFLSSDELIPRNLYRHAMKKGLNNFIRKITRRKIQPLAYTYWYESYFQELYDFFECIRHDTEPSVTITDGLKTMALIEKAYDISKPLEDTGSEEIE